MALAKVTIIGRPNVGKSSLLNALAGQMISIVEPTAGVTRDRVSTLVGRDGRYFELIDTGGYGIVDADQLCEHIEHQIRQAIETADLVLFMTDIRDGVVPLDETIARLLRKQQLNVIGVANKADEGKLFPAAAEFSKLGFGEFLCISALNNMNKNVLLERICEQLEGFDSDKPDEPVMKLAIVGKRNAGKSTLLNAIVGQQRVIVSEIPGTTRDAVDVRFEKDGKTFVAIDTAGLRKKRSLADDIEYYGYVRAAKSVQRADVVLFMIDATLPISQVDKKLSKLILDEYKTCILVINKWDLAKDQAATDDYGAYLDKVLPGLGYAPIAFTTAKDAKNVQSVLDLAIELHKQATTQIPTAKLNKAFEIIRDQKVAARRTRTGKPPKVYYGTQVAVNPITILMFVNEPAHFEQRYLRFLTNRLRELLDIQEVPLRLLLRSHRESGKLKSPVKRKA